LFQSTYKNYKCHTDERGDGCIWKKDYRLGPSKTKEFRFYCTDNHLEPNSVGVDNTKSSTTCTKAVHWGNYITMSCTNWDPTSGDRVSPWVYCW
jgi:hypothetical protein